MSLADALADFAADATRADLPPAAADATKRRVFDAACAAHAADTQLLAAVDATTDAAGGDACTRWAADARAGPANAAYANAARVRESGRSDAFIAPDGLVHPSDAIPAVVAAAEAADADGATLVAAVAAAYEAHGELAWHAPVREHDHGPAALSAVGAAVGAAVALGLDAAAARDAVLLAADDAPRDADATTLAAANAANAGVTSAFLAANGADGPANAIRSHPVFAALDDELARDDADVARAENSDACEFADGGDPDADDACEFDGDGVDVFGEDTTGFALDPACERVHDAASRRYVAPVAVQSAVTAAADLAARADVDPSDVAAVTLRTFDSLTLPAPTTDPDPATPADAARSLPYALAVALRERTFAPAHCDPVDPDAVSLARRVTVRETSALTTQVDAGLLPAVLDVELSDGTRHHTEVGAAPGHPTQPMDWVALADTARERLPAGRVRSLRDACEALDDGGLDALLAALA
ncbi:MAG: MmgE/PrpD family protein [Halarchaeum sp.]